MSKKPELSVNAIRALEMLKENGSLTVAQMKDKGFTEVNSSHLVALKKRGLVDSVEFEIEVPTTVKRKVQLYTIVKNDNDSE